MIIGIFCSVCSTFNIYLKLFPTPMKVLPISDYCTGVWLYPGNMTRRYICFKALKFHCPNWDPNPGPAMKVKHRNHCNIGPLPISVHIGCKKMNTIIICYHRNKIYLTHLYHVGSIQD